MVDSPIPCDGSMMSLDRVMFKSLPFVHVWFSTQCTYEQSMIVEAIFEELNLRNAVEMEGKGAFVRIRDSMECSIIQITDELAEPSLNTKSDSSGKITIEEIELMCRTVMTAGALFVVLYGELSRIYSEIQSAKQWVEERLEILPIPVIAVFNTFNYPFKRFEMVDLHFESDQASGICSIRRVLLMERAKSQDPILKHIASIISGLAIFKTLEAEDSMTLVRSARYVFFRSGSLVHDSSASDFESARCCIILRGTAKRICDGNFSDMERIYGPRHYFGEFFLLDESSPRSRNLRIMAVSSLDVITIHRSAFLSLRKQNSIKEVVEILKSPLDVRHEPDGARLLELFNTSMRVGSKGFPLSISFFPDFEQHKRIELARTLQIRFYKESDIICKHGDFENAYCIILSGDIQAISQGMNSYQAKRSDEIEMSSNSIITFGQSFGHAALEAKMSRVPLTMVALTAVCLIELSRKDFHKVIRAYTEVHRSSKLASVKRLFPFLTLTDDDSVCRLKEYRKGDMIAMQGSDLRHVTTSTDFQGETDQVPAAMNVSKASNPNSTRQSDVVKVDMFLDFIVHGEVQLLQKSEFEMKDISNPQFAVKNVSEKSRAMPGSLNLRMQQAIPLFELSSGNSLNAMDLFSESTTYSFSAVAASDVSILSISLSAIQSNFPVQKLNEIRMLGLQHAHSCKKISFLCKNETHHVPAHQQRDWTVTANIVPWSSKEWSDWFLVARRTDVHTSKMSANVSPYTVRPSSADKASPHLFTASTRQDTFASARNPRVTSYALTQDRRAVYRERFGLSSPKGKDVNESNEYQFFQRKSRPQTAGAESALQRQQRLERLAEPSPRTRRLPRPAAMSGESAESNGCWCNKELPRHKGIMYSLTCRTATAGMPTFASWRFSNGRIRFGPHRTVDDILMSSIPPSKGVDRSTTRASRISAAVSSEVSCRTNSVFSNFKAVSEAKDDAIVSPRPEDVVL